MLNERGISVQEYNLETVSDCERGAEYHLIEAEELLDGVENDLIMQCLWTV